MPNQMIPHPYGMKSQLLAQSRTVDNVKIFARGSVNLQDARDGIAAVAGLMAHARRNKSNFSRLEAKLFSLDDGLDGAFQYDVNILRFSVIVRRTRSGIDVNQID